MNYAGLKKMVFTALIIDMLTCVSVSAADKEPVLKTTGWNTEESNSFIIYYRPTADLKALERRLSMKGLLSGQSPVYSEINPAEEIRKRLDSLFDEVKGILGMHPVVEKVKIKIFKDTNELNETYLILFGKKGDFKSFYINKSNTIYTAESSITDSIMVHEMAHVVIDHYFSVVPPEIINEMIASYVDMHFSK